jgi:hypothetical protein
MDSIDSLTLIDFTFYDIFQYSVTGAHWHYNLQYILVNANVIYVKNVSVILPVHASRLPKGSLYVKLTKKLY